MEPIIYIDEIGRYYLCTEEGKPYSGPYDTEEEATKAWDCDDDDD